MNRSIRRVGISVTVLMLLLVAQLTYLQIVDAHKLANDPRNVRTQLRDFNRPRGQILTADGQIVARSVASAGDFKYQREYPLKDLFSQVVGYQSFLLGNTGVEATYDRALTGRDTELTLGNLGAVVSGNADTANVVLSLSAAAQTAARDALGSQQGSVVAIDVKTGAIVAMYSNPSYDPQSLAGHDTQAVQTAFTALTSDPANPALPRAYREIYPPGSTFKIVTTAAALDDGKATTDRQFPVVTDIPVPQTTNTLSNFGGELCGGSLIDSLVQSCNTTFGTLGLELGNDFVTRMANCGVGVGSPPIDLRPGAVGSIGPAAGSFDQNKPNFAFAGIGQGDVAVTPLEMALVAAGIANGGVIMEPHVVAEIQYTDGSTATTITPKPWKTCATPQNARTLTDMMVQVVNRGTGTGAQIPGVTVAGKTGTAQNASGKPHAWFTAFAPAEAPRYAVAVIVPNGGSNNNPEITGGAVAAPIARQVLQTLLGR